MRKLISFLFFMLFSAAICAQITLAPTVISSGGGYAEGENISISWTLGELAVTTLTGGNMILTQGFQQPSDIGVGISSNEVNWNISVYPNPVGDELSIRFDIDKPGDFLVEIQDVTGRLISQEQHKQINPGDIILLNTSTYTHGVYFLKVFTPDRQQVQVTSIRKL
ncbi:MAG: T9SS type A sorting domain-containing protein [Bacteroidales bacterium]|nr:T9SS type A sorting domain-containing protein [Bacteroidales bacterium]